MNSLRDLRDLVVAIFRYGVLIMNLPNGIHIDLWYCRVSTDSLGPTVVRKHLTI